MMVQSVNVSAKNFILHWKWISIFEEKSRILQTPAALAEPGFIYELRSGASLRAIRRFFLFYRMNLIVENALDTILAGKE